MDQKQGIVYRAARGAAEAPGVGALILVLLVLSFPASAEGSTYFVFAQRGARPGQTVTVRAGGTPSSFRRSQRVRPFQTPLMLFLVSNAVADDVRSPRDQRLTAIGRFVGDRDGRGLLRFVVPALAPGRYTIAIWRTEARCRHAGICGPRFYSASVTSRNTVPSVAPRLILTVTTRKQGFSLRLAAGLGTATLLVTAGAGLMLRRRRRA